jgi:hypothetical protein
MTVLKLLDPERIWYLKPGASEADIDALEARFAMKLPSDYREIMRSSDGADFEFTDTYFRLWSVASVEDRNIQCSVQRYIPGALAIGNDAGDIWYLLDFTRTPGPALIELEAGNLDRADSILRGNSLTEALRAWSGLDDARARLLGCMADRLTSTS